MRDKIEQLTHIDRQTRVEILRWCRDYETEILHLQRQCEMLGATKRMDEDSSIINIILTDVTQAVKRAGRCTVLRNVSGKFKVLTQEVRIAKESNGSEWVGNYGTKFKRSDVVEDILFILNAARVKVVHSE